MEFILLLVAFVLGFGCKLINMPPLIGYLVAGFCLHALGYSSNPQLEEIATTKMPDLTAADMDAAVRTIAGTARSMGIEVEG